MTAWYPRADVTPAAQATHVTLTTPAFASTATWSKVAVTPHAPESFPVEPGSSRYDAARRLEAILTREGLYPREARAMVDTWRDSWF